MISNISSLLNAAISMIKRLHLGRAIAIVCMGILVVTTTACNPQSPQAVGSGGSYHENDRVESGLREYTDRADGKRRPDLNSYRDESAQDQAGTRAKADQLAQRARQNVKRVNSPDELVDEIRSGRPLDERIKNQVDSVRDAASEVADDLSQGARKGSRNLKRNTERAGEAVQNSVEDASDVAQDRVRDATNSINSGSRS
jgi:hypothetical protein